MTTNHDTNAAPAGDPAAKPGATGLAGPAFTRVRTRNLHRAVARIVATAAGAEAGRVDVEPDDGKLTVTLTGTACWRLPEADEEALKRLIERSTMCTVEIDEPQSDAGPAVRWRLSPKNAGPCTRPTRMKELKTALRFVDIPVVVEGQDIVRVQFPGEPVIGDDNRAGAGELYYLYAADDARNAAPGILAGGYAFAADALPHVPVYGDGPRTGRLGIAVRAPNGGPHAAMEGGEATRIGKLAASALTAQQALRFAASAAESAAAAGRLPGMPRSSLEELRHWGAEIPEIPTDVAVVPEEPGGEDAAGSGHHDIVSDRERLAADLATITGMVSRTLLDRDRIRGTDDDDALDAGEAWQRTRRETDIMRETARRLWDDDNARKVAVEATVAGTVQKKDLAAGPLTVRLHLAENGDIDARCIDEQA